MGIDSRAAAVATDTALGVELGSTYTEAALIGLDREVLATGGHDWENHLEGGPWSHAPDEVVASLHAIYASLVVGMHERYNVILASYGPIGISAVIRGYLVFDAEGNLLMSFRT